MDIEFDTAKDEANHAKHGLSLAFGARLFDDINHIVGGTVRPADREARFKVIGMVDGKLYSAVHVHRGAATRFISVRRSNDAEEKLYHRR
jgi:uncharacterized DUF497 family protein